MELSTNRENFLRITQGHASGTTLWFFAQYGQHVAPMGVKFGVDESTPPRQISPPSMQGWSYRTLEL